jgi:hypothetical protein
VHLKTLRQASRRCEELATPLVFDVIAFDLESGGCNSLISIANSLELSKHVRTIRLKRRGGLKSFDSIEGWHAANIYEHVLGSNMGLVASAPRGPHSMLREEWKALDKDALRCLYDGYEQDKEELWAYMSQLASSTFLCAPAGACSKDEGRHHPSEAQHTTAAFIVAANMLTNVSDFAYTPAYRYENS